MKRTYNEITTNLRRDETKRNQCSEGGGDMGLVPRGSSLQEPVLEGASVGAAAVHSNAERSPELQSLALTTDCAHA